MNKYLFAFFKDEIKNNDYYEPLREFEDLKNGKKGDYDDLVQTITSYYDDNIDYFPPYKFVDGINDYVDSNRDAWNGSDLYELIEKAFEEGHMENY